MVLEAAEAEAEASPPAEGLGEADAPADIASVVTPSYALEAAAHGDDAVAATNPTRARAAAVVVPGETRSRGWGTGHAGAGEAVSFRTPAWLHRQRGLRRSRHDYR